MKKLPVGVQTFDKLIKGDFLYIDKTKYIFRLIDQGGQYHFLSRPLRFGKSLLLSTFEELFSGNKELFKGLWIYDKIDWEKNPVIHIDFTDIEYENSSLLKQSLVETLDIIGAKHGIQLTTVSYKTRFSELIRKLSANGKVVILIDEYDKPIIDHIGNKEVAESNRKTLSNFYGVIKSADQYIKFAFLTGVTKFSKVSVFSGLNNLRDITLSEPHATLLGVTQDELLLYFDEHIARLSGKTGIDREILEKKIREWYNGYSWDGENFVYNPFSLLTLFNENNFDNFWFSTGTPRFLVDLIKEQPYVLPKLDRWPVSSFAFDSYDPDRMEVTPLLFQSGYLTIKKITTDEEEKSYHLDFPNQEVKNSFLIYLLQEFTTQSKVFGSHFLKRVAKIIETDDFENLIVEMKSHFASVPHQIFIKEREAYYHTIVYLLLKLAGGDVTPEETTSMGRIDAVLETKKKAFVMEFKMGRGSEAEALAQIKEKKYYEKYLNRGKEIVLVGIGFDPDARNIDQYITETI